MPNLHVDNFEKQSFMNGIKKILGAKYGKITYKKSNKISFGLILKHQEPGVSEVYEQSWSIGNGWEDVDDGNDCRSKSGKGKLPAGSNFSIFIDSLRDAGFPLDLLETGYADDFIGYTFEFGNFAIERDFKDDGGKKPQTVPIVINIISGPDGESINSNTNDDEPNEDVAERVIKAIEGKLKDNPEGIRKKSLSKLMMEYGKETELGSDSITDMLELCNDEEFLGHKDRSWTLKNAKLKSKED